MLNITQMDAGKVVHQTLLEQLFNKNQLIPRIKAEFIGSTSPNFITLIKEANLNVDFGINMLIQMVLHKRTNLPTLVGILRHHFHNLQECADALLVAAEADLVDWDPTTEQFILKYNISEDVQADIDKFQYPLPMIIEPKMLETNLDSPYMTVKRNSIILRDNHHSEDVCLDHINRMNAVKLTINDDTATMINNRWRNLDKPKENETRFEYNKRVKAFEKYDRGAKDVIDLLVKEGRDFYLPHKYDKRGRTYCQGYFINYQGTPWNKACVELADKELIT